MDGVAKSIARALRRHGRFVAELGGKGNIRQIECAVEAVAARYCGSNVPERRTVYPSIGEYSSILEVHSLEVRSAALFDRPTRLDGDQGMENWIRQFKWFYFEALSPFQRARALQETIEELRPVLFQDGNWFADYRRLRITAARL
jgi:hypothetical protein